jgi:sigma-54 specific flagellar transcriptional regulator A
MSFDQNDDFRVSTVQPVAPRRTLVPTRSGKIIGRHPVLKSVLETVDRVSRSSCTVLITGESGTGKELIVAALHERSPRAGSALVAVNCGAIPENLIESELFGHAKGAFTGAHATRIGRVAAAEGGTLFLDEVGELPLQVQVKLLRLLQQKEYSPVGDTRAIKCNVRIVAATNRDLEKEVAAGRFREDLYYRLNVIHVHLPALRERGSDVEDLAEHFFRVAAARAGRDDLEGLGPDALEAIRRHDWPGNVRALENAIERAVLLARGPLVSSEDLPDRVRSGSPGRSAAEPTENAFPESGVNLRAAVEAFENKLIREALERSGWNKNRAAALLGINRTTLVEMVKRKRLEAQKTGTDGG